MGPCQRAAPDLQSRLDFALLARCSRKNTERSAFSSFRRSRLGYGGVHVVLFFNGLLLGASGIAFAFIILASFGGARSGDNSAHFYSCGHDLSGSGGLHGLRSGGFDCAIRAYHRGAAGGGIFWFSLARSAALRKSHSTLKQTAGCASPLEYFPPVPFIGSRRCHRLYGLCGHCHHHPDLSGDFWRVSCPFSLVAAGALEVARSVLAISGDAGERFLGRPVREGPFSWMGGAASGLWHVFVYAIRANLRCDRDCLGLAGRSRRGG